MASPTEHSDHPNSCGLRSATPALQSTSAPDSSMRGIHVDPISHRSGTFPDAIAAVIFSSPLCHVSCSIRTRTPGCSCWNLSTSGWTTSVGQNCQNTTSSLAFGAHEPSAINTPKTAAPATASRRVLE